jgi:hypothetical protein
MASGGRPKVMGRRMLEMVLCKLERAEEKEKSEKKGKDDKEKGIASSPPFQRVV